MSFGDMFDFGSIDPLNEGWPTDDDWESYYPAEVPRVESEVISLEEEVKVEPGDLESQVQDSVKEEEPPHFGVLDEDCWRKVIEQLELRDRIEIESTSSGMKEMIDGLWLAQKNLRLSRTSASCLSVCPIESHRTIWDSQQLWLDSKHYRANLKILKRTPNLESLSVSFAIPDDLGPKISERCPKLEHLVIGPSFGASDDVFPQIDPSNLTCLGIGYCGRRSHNIQTVDLIRRCSSKLKHLRVHLYFFTDHCELSPVERAEAIVNSVPQLVSLNARETPTAAINVLAGLKSLKRLSIDLMPVEDIGVLNKFKNLECLEVESIWNGETDSEATNRAIESVIRRMGLTIQKLDMFCIYFTPKNALLLPQVCPNLRILRIAANADDALFRAFKSFKHLKELTVFGWEEIPVGRAALLSDGFFDFLEGHKTLTYLRTYGVVIKDFPQVFDAVVNFARNSSDRQVEFMIEAFRTGDEIEEVFPVLVASCPDYPRNLFFEVDDLSCINYTWDPAQDYQEEFIPPLAPEVADQALFEELEQIEVSRPRNSLLNLVRETISTNLIAINNPVVAFVRRVLLCIQSLFY